MEHATTGSFQLASGLEEFPGNRAGAGLVRALPVNVNTVMSTGYRLRQILRFAREGISHWEQARSNTLRGITIITSYRD